MIRDAARLAGEDVEAAQEALAAGLSPLDAAYALTVEQARLADLLALTAWFGRT
jgi:hypothetical protein